MSLIINPYAFSSGGSTPVVAATATSTGNSLSANPFPITLPAGIVAGNLLVVHIFATAAITYTWPAGWTELYDSNGIAGAWRIADGSEGATVDVTLSASVNGLVAFSERITGAHASAAPEAGTVATTADPPSLSPSWGALNTLWIAVAGVLANTTVTAFPTNYADNQLQQSSGIGTIVTAGLSTRGLNSASENPGAYTFGAGSTFRAQTLAVRPT